MYRGYIKVWRKLRDSFLWEDLAGIKLWLHILMETNHADKEHLFNNEKTIIKRGQMISGRQSLERELGINESKIYRLLELMEREQLIEQQKNNRYTMITVLNYNSYQQNEQQNEQPVNNQRTTSEQPVNTPKYIKKALRNIKNTLKEPSNGFVTNVFNHFCLKTGLKLKLTKDRERIILHLKDEPLDNIKKAIDNFSNDDWADRHKYNDFVYCLGTRNKVNNYEKWLNYKETPKNAGLGWDGKEGQL